MMYNRRGLQFQGVKWIYGEPAYMSVGNAAADVLLTVRSCHPIQPPGIASMDAVL